MRPRVLLLAAALVLGAAAPAGAASLLSTTGFVGITPGWSDGTFAQRAAVGGTTSTCDSNVTDARGAATPFRKYRILNATNEPTCISVAVNAVNPSIGNCNEDTIGSVAYAGALDLADGTVNQVGSGGHTNITANTPDIGYAFTLPGGTEGTVVVQTDGASVPNCNLFNISLDVDRPYAQSPPLASGTPYDGQVLTGSRNAWLNSTGESTQWVRCDAGGDACADIPGQTGATYQLTTADIGSTFRFRTIATDGVKTSSSDSVATPVVSGIPPAPRYTRTTSSGATPGSGSTSLGVSGVSPTAPLTLPFGVQLYGRTVTEAVVSVFGALQFGPAATVVGDSAPTCGGPSPKLGGALLPLLAAWDADPAAGQGVFWGVSGAAPNRELVLEWRVADVFLNPARFTITLREGSPTVTYVYGDSSAATGVTSESSMQQTPVGEADELRCDGTPPAAGTRVDYTPSLPALSGTPFVGGALAYANGEWTGTAPLSFAQQWQRCDASGSACADIPGATGATYGVSAADAGRTLRVRVTGANVAGSGTAVSPPSTVVPTPPADVVVTPSCGVTGRPACPLARLSALTVSPSTFRPARSGGATASAAAKRTAKVGFRLSDSSRVRFTVVAVTIGRRSGKRCVQATRANRRARACQRLVTRLTFTRSAKKGANSFRLTGRISARRKLAVGRYRLTAVPVEGRRIGKTVTKAFRVAR